MSLLERTVSWDQLVRWGALRMYPEKQVRAWFGDGPDLTVDRVLAIGTKAPRVYWTVLRPEVVPDSVLHLVAHALCSDLLDRLEEEGAYLDFRLRVGLDHKLRWIRGGCTSGELAHHQRQADRAQVDVAEHPTGAADATLAASAVRSALDLDGSEAFKGVFFTVVDRFDDDRQRRAIHARVRSTLADPGAAAAQETP